MALAHEALFTHRRAPGIVVVLIGQHETEFAVQMCGGGQAAHGGQPDTRIAACIGRCERQAHQMRTHAMAARVVARDEEAQARALGRCLAAIEREAAQKVPVAPGTPDQCLVVRHGREFGGFARDDALEHRWPAQGADVIAPVPAHEFTEQARHPAGMHHDRSVVHSSMSPST